MEVLLVAALVLGFGGSLHCVGMCGPLMLAMPFQLFGEKGKWLAWALYQLGRISGYAILGLILGLLGRGINWFGISQGISIFLGIAVILSVVVPSLFRNTKVPGLDSLKTFQLKVLGFLSKKRSISWMYVSGIANGFLPCGLVYVALAAALTENNVLHATLFMTLFGLGTIPALASVTLAGQKISGITRQKLRNLTPAFTILIGALLLLRGLNLNIPYISPQMEMQDGKANVSCCHKPR